MGIRDDGIERARSVSACFRLRKEASARQADATGACAATEATSRPDNDGWGWAGSARTVRSCDSFRNLTFVFCGSVIRTVVRRVKNRDFVRDQGFQRDKRDGRHSHDLQCENVDKAVNAINAFISAKNVNNGD